MAILRRWRNGWKSDLKVHYPSPVIEKLNNLIFTISCNLQRLDGPVNGNGKIVQELKHSLPVVAGK